ncbi:hypothetical protein SEA_OTTERSTEDTS21_25 [Gordonia phage OtterstedtS21]|uniref:Tail assembly chaperone n=5 Tax=Lambovirus TaxID=2843412 RepID=A0A9E7U4S1_9CAUD|nr:tail assembly chaperone [Gordonia phage Ranch]YP_009852676.1 tail assembly chaperone [Gordonia phage Sadboi]QFG08164.1 hypothetical protein PBI_GRETELLYN_25 [Gordonia phage GretelLyn]UJQ86093.1 hypothetical protein ZANY_23 [Gordonia phage Zany]UVT31188.1 hypothetical protein SEA_OTTERSTEDTS21_25 [Gordonia phage OtterstedtS21]QFG12336.1 hypothetical protein PBI_RANCH_25 [Gordonia phage Ranch]QFG14675.1 hypothetical protein PBI_SADBOI_25 [Gordonia phage Sadboi]
MSKYEPTAWGQSDDLIDIPLPSGQLCQARTLEMEDIIRLGLINDLDTFSSAFGDDNEDRDGIEFLKSVTDSGAFDKLTRTLNIVVVDRVVQPKVYAVPDQKKERKADRIYIDQIKFTDKMAIFSVVFKGLGDMGDFREESGDGVGAVESKPIVEGAPL